MTIVDDFLDHLAAGRLALGTRRLRAWHLAALQDRHPDLLAVTDRDLTAQLAALTDRGLAPETVKSWKASFGAFYGWALRQELITKDPTAQLIGIRVPATESRVCPDEAILAALKTATFHERGMILLGRYAALRLTEITTLHTRHHLSGSLLRVTGKGGKTRLVPIPEQLETWLRDAEARQGEGFYFPGRFTGSLSRFTVEKAIQRRVGWNPHSLRHAWATDAYRKTHNLRAIQEFLGHASLATTQRYIKTGMDELRLVADAAVIEGDAE